MPLVIFALVLFGGAAINNHNADKKVESWSDAKHAVEVSVEQRKPPGRVYN